MKKDFKNLKDGDKILIRVYSCGLIEPAEQNAKMGEIVYEIQVVATRKIADTSI